MTTTSFMATGSSGLFYVRRRAQLGSGNTTPAAVAQHSFTTHGLAAVISLLERSTQDRPNLQPRPLF